MATIAPVNRYLRVVPLLVKPGSIPPSGPAIQPGKKPVWVVGAIALGRFAATSTTKMLIARIAPSDSAPTSSPVSRRACVPARRRHGQIEAPADGVSPAARPRGMVVASPGMLSRRHDIRSGHAEGPRERALERWFQKTRRDRRACD